MNNTLDNTNTFSRSLWYSFFLYLNQFWLFAWTILILSLMLPATVLLLLTSAFGFSADLKLLVIALAVLAAIETSIFIVTYALGNITHRARVRELCIGQEARDRRATEILEKVENGDAPEYSVYLRTFGVTNQLNLSYSDPKNLFRGSGRVNLQRPLNSLLGRVHRDRDRDLEMLIAESMETYRPLIALGKPGESFGAGRIRTNDDDWQGKIDILLKYASIIIMIPSHREGTRWEATWLLFRREWPKVLFVMPPTDRYTEANNLRDWEAVSESLGQIGIQLPRYDVRGMVFIIDEHGQPRAWRNLPKKFNPEVLRENIKILFKISVVAVGSQGHTLDEIHQRTPERLRNLIRGISKINSTNATGECKPTPPESIPPGP